MTTVYFIRHSKAMKSKNLNWNEHLQMQNEKWILSVEGENRARILSELEELSNIDLVVASNYVRTISTAKYIAIKNNQEIFIDERFGERKQGISSWDEYPSDFEKRQFDDEDYKIGDGESQKEVRERIDKALNDLLNNNRNKRIALIFHGTAMIFYLKKWCNIVLEGDVYKMSFKEKIFFENSFNAPELFKTVFSENHELVSIENIRPTVLETKEDSFL